MTKVIDAAIPHITEPRRYLVCSAHFPNLRISNAIRGNQFILDGYMIGEGRSQGLSGCAKRLAERVRGGA